MDVSHSRAPAPMDYSTRVPRAVAARLPEIRQVRSGTYTRQRTSNDLSQPRNEPNTGESWTLLPKESWSDEFSPLYSNGAGCLCEGVPSDPMADTPELIQCRTEGPDGAPEEFEVVQNEAFVEFDPCVPAGEIRSLLGAFGLDVLHAWFEPDASAPADSMSWFHVGVRPTSRYYCHVECLVPEIQKCKGVVRAGYNDVASLSAALFGPGQIPNVRSWVTQASANEYYDTVYAQLSGARYTSAYFRARLASTDGAWYSAAADMGDENSSWADTCVVIMDTGVDLDHPDFGASGARREDYEGKIWTVNRDAVDGQGMPVTNRVRVGISARKDHAIFNEVGPWMPELGQPQFDCTKRQGDPSWIGTPACPDGFQDLQRAPSSPRPVVPTGYVAELWKRRRGEEILESVARTVVDRASKDPNPADPRLCLSSDPTKPVSCGKGVPPGADAGCCGVPPDPLKFIDLRYRGCAHGTAMAGIIGARGSDGGVVSFGSPRVKFISAQLRMVGHYRVDIASAVSCVKILRRTCPASAGYRVVYMGFSQDASRRSHASDDGMMDTLLKAMRKDRNDRKDGTRGHDRLWIAPAGFGGTGRLLSYPAAIHWKDIFTPPGDPDAEGKPVVLGVTSVRWSGEFLAPITGSFFSPKYDSKRKKIIDDSGPVERRAYGISAVAGPVVTTDVRESWYGARWYYDPRRDDQDWKDQDLPEMEGGPPRDPPNAKTHTPRYLVGYAGDNKLTGDSDPRNGAGYRSRASDVVDGLGAGGYVSDGELSESMVKSNANVRVLGSSVAAAQVASLAGMLWAKHASDQFPPTAAKIAKHLVASYQTGDTSLKQGKDAEGKDTYTAAREQASGVVPAPVDFLWALENDFGSARRLSR